MRGRVTTHGKNIKVQRKLINKQEKSEKRRRASDRLSYLEAISETLSLPQEILSGAPVLNIHGRNSLLLENYKKVLEYTDTLIRIQTKLYYVNIFGNDLKIQYYTKDEMRVDGVFKNIEFS
jgi:sporulation protein YqfC